MERAYAQHKASKGLGLLLLIHGLALVPLWVKAQQTRVEVFVHALSDTSNGNHPQGTFQARSLRINFRTQSPRRPPRYKVKLLGDGYEQWLEVGTSTQVIFTRLGGGKYAILVGDSANECEGRVDFEIETTLFETWWFWVITGIYVLGVIGVIFYLLFLYRYQQKLRLLRMREHVARDLHDDMGSQLSSISILSQNLEQMAQQNPDLARHYLKRIGETARQVMDSMSDIVWSVNPQKDALPHMAERMQGFASELFEASDTELHFFRDPELIKTTLELTKRHDFYMIFKEGVTNAARYAQATTVDIRLERKQEILHLSIQDNGVGFDPEHPPRSQGGNGLRNMRVRADKIGATLLISSLEKQGTLLVLTLPMG